eukprot:TRINITY_DN35142_c0_g1_i1.p1 TRINITY_DN35142_c0_g1~~TRINITY_DN35142_c0_g1_i1.p1  ORF type:complete len:493 (-),score=118.14 TRINITY_DN35142_c0_g1_i1:61-1482(-)
MWASRLGEGMPLLARAGAGTLSRQLVAALSADASQGAQRLQRRQLAGHRLRSYGALGPRQRYAPFGIVQRHAATDGPAAGGDGSAPGGSKAAALEKAADKAAQPVDADVPGGTTPASASSEVPAVSKTTSATVAEGKTVDSTIDQILIRKSREDVIQKAGTEAVRYLPTEDPNAFLLPASRLEPGERTWQKVFVATPWFVFAVMLAVPLVLVRYNLPLIQQKAEEEKRRTDERLASLSPVRRVSEFTIVNFGQMPDVLERPFPTIILLFDPSTFASQVFLPLCRDLAAAFQAAELPVAVAALDLSADPAPSDDFLWQYPRALSPHFQLVLPRATDGEAGVVDYDGRWGAAALAEAGRRMAGEYAPQVQAEDLVRLEGLLERLRDTLFEMHFLEGGAAAVAAEETASKPPAWKRVLGLGGRSAEAVAKASEERHCAASAAMEERCKPALLTGGLEEAVRACEAALLRPLNAAAS